LKQDIEHEKYLQGELELLWN